MIPISIVAFRDPHTPMAANQRRGPSELPPLPSPLAPAPLAKTLGMRGLADAAEAFLFPAEARTARNDL